MADAPKTSYTLAEVRQRQRQAFMHGAGWMAERNGLPYEIGACDAEIGRRYPAPTKPRVVKTSDGTAYRILNGVVQFRCSDGSWTKSVDWTAERVRVIADLLAHPEEPADA